MTTVEAGHRREELRQDLAAVVAVEPGVLDDRSRLCDIGLDSLAMMRLLVRLEALGVTLDTVDLDPGTRVGEVLTLLEHASNPAVTIRLGIDGASVHGGLLGMPTAPGRAVDPLAPVLRTSAFHLTPVRPDDLEFLFNLATSPATSFRWRYRGAPPSMERFREGLWQQILVQYVARRLDNDDPVGHLMSYGADPGMRYAYVGAVFTPTFAGTGLAARAVATFIRHLFHVFPLHKLYLQIPGYNWHQMSSGQGDLFQVEGVLKDHCYLAGQLWDEYLCAVYADQFRDIGED
jgi:RimJ/RimL family protein N-acetyltransferase/aryl carrier-like protein